MEHASAARFWVSVPALPLLAEPDDTAEWVTEAVHGEPAHVIEQRGEWARVVLPLQRCSADDRGYPGWARRAGLTQGSTHPQWQTHVRCAEVLDSAGRFLAKLPCGAVLERATGPDRQYMECVRLGAYSEAYVRSDAVAAWPVQQAGRDTLLTGLAMWSDQPYVWGGTNSITGSDCSGLVYRSYQRAGVLLPRDADDQYTMAPERHGTGLSEIEEGDLVFFRRAADETISHVGLYVGHGNNLSANQRANGMSTDPIDLSAFVGWARYLS